MMVATEDQQDRVAPLCDIEKGYIEIVLRKAGGNQRRASKMLGITRWSLKRRLRKYGLDPRTVVETVERRGAPHEI